MGRLIFQAWIKPVHHTTYSGARSAKLRPLGVVSHYLALAGFRMERGVKHREALWASHLTQAPPPSPPIPPQEKPLLARETATTTRDSDQPLCAGAAAINCGDLVRSHQGPAHRTHHGRHYLLVESVCASGRSPREAPRSRGPGCHRQTCRTAT